MTLPIVPLRGSEQGEVSVILEQEKSGQKKAFFVVATTVVGIPHSLDNVKCRSVVWPRGISSLVSKSTD